MNGRSLSFSGSKSDYSSEVQINQIHRFETKQREYLDDIQIEIDQPNLISEIVESNSKNYYEKQSQQTKTIFQMSFNKQKKQEETQLQQFNEYMAGNTHIKRGHVQLRYNNQSYNKVLLQLSRDKLIELQNNGNTNGKVINLKYFHFLCEKHPKLNDVLLLHFPKMKKIISIKVNNQIEFKIWFQCFKMIEDVYRNVLKIKTNELFFTLDFIREDEFSAMAETGDILLFETDYYMAKIQRTLTNSPYDHVGFVIRDSRSIYVVDAKFDTGVAELYWPNYILSNDLFKKIAFRKLLNVDRNTIEKKFKEFISQVKGQEYELNLKKLVQFETNNILQKGYFCSELVAKAYKYCGLFSTSKASSSYWPVTFTKKMNLLQGAVLSEPIAILLNRDILQK